jgi:hypothetical protein
MFLVVAIFSLHFVNFSAAGHSCKMKQLKFHLKEGKKNPERRFFRKVE